MGSYINSIPLPPRVMTEAEQNTLLKVTGQNKEGFRDHIIIAMALGTGLREHELAAFNVGDVLGADEKVLRRIHLRVFKRSSQKPALQEVIISEGLRAKLTKFLQWKKHHNERIDSGAPLFISRKGNRLSTRQMRNMLKKWQIRAGFERPYNFHSLRHASCSNIYQRTKDIRITQRFARHKSIVTTQRYAHASLEDLVRAVQGLPC